MAGADRRTRHDSRGESRRSVGLVRADPWNRALHWSALADAPPTFPNPTGKASAGGALAGAGGQYGMIRRLPFCPPFRPLCRRSARVLSWRDGSGALRTLRRRPWPYGVVLLPRLDHAREASSPPAATLGIIGQPSYPIAPAHRPPDRHPPRPRGDNRQRSLPVAPAQHMATKHIRSSKLLLSPRQLIGWRQTRHSK